MVLVLLILASLFWTGDICTRAEGGEESTAAGSSLRLSDEADLLTDSQEQELKKRLDGISERHACDVVIVTVSDTEGRTPESYAHDRFDMGGYGYGSERDGILLLVSMSKHDWYISTSGSGSETFTDAGIKYMGEQFLPLLSKGKYEKAFVKYADLCDQFLVQAQTGKPFDKNNLPRKPLRLFYFAVAIGIGVVLSLLVVIGMVRQLKAVRRQNKADSYMVKNSMYLTDSRDVFLYRSVSRTERPKKSGSGSRTHRSSSGRIHGGGGGKF